MRSASFFGSLALGVVVVAGAFAPGCGDDPEFTPAEDAGPLDTYVPPTVTPFGLDTRPLNPTCKAPPPLPDDSAVKLEQQFGTATFGAPVGIFQAPGDNSRFFVLQQSGQVKVFPATATSDADVKTFIDMSTALSLDYGGEKGLLGFAFHPDWATNRFAFLSYTKKSGDDGKPFSIISRFKSNDDGLTLDLAETKIFDKVQQPFANHNGGNIAFGKDGRLYIGFGDGGSGGDPLGNGQNKNVFFSKMLRLDVNGALPYTVPNDNPFAPGGTNPGAGAPEIWAMGFRNPWRWSFDKETGDMWVGDVGQDVWEEVDKVQMGGNYGWNQREATHCYPAGSTTCQTAGLIDPIAEYKHDGTGGVSITGGFVYRGTAIPSLVGIYVYGDFGSGRIWGLFPDATTGKLTPRVLIDASGKGISSFGQDNAGELYLTDYGSGHVFKFVSNTSTAPVNFPLTLSATGCVDPKNPQLPAASMIPYAPISPLWSDGADKERWFALPDGATIDVNAEGHFDFPKGTVLMKNFRVGGKLVETRLFIRHVETGDFAGYTYEWNDAGTDANLLHGSKRKDVGGGATWYYPGRGECLGCHTTAAGRSLGLEIAQLNSDFIYPGNKQSNQLTTFDHIGVLTKALSAPVGSLPAFKNPTGTGDVGDRARAYLHTNCSFCHRPQGGGGGEIDLRFATAFKDTKTCNVDPKQGDLGITGAKIIAAGSPDKSVLSKRVHSADVNRMPPIASHLVDTAGVATIDSWIQSLTSCP